MRKLFLALAAVAALAFVGQAGAATKTISIYGTRCQSEVGDDHGGRHRHLGEPGQRESSGAGFQGRVRVADPETEADVLVHVQVAGDVFVQRRALPQAHGARSS